jgi:hypothetical protein
MPPSTPTPAATPLAAPTVPRLLALLICLSIAASLCAAWIFDHPNAGRSLFELSNLVGPTTYNLLHGTGLSVCTDAMGTPQDPICFHAARMPLPSLVVGLGVKFLGNHYLRVAFFKTILLLFPVEVAIYLVWLRMSPSPRRRLCIGLLLLAPFAITAFLANVVNLQVEEAYTYSFLALSVAILFFGLQATDSHASPRGLWQALAFALAVDGIYLAKSSMTPAVVVLLLAYLLMERRPAQRILVLLLVAAAPVCWALRQHHFSGRYTIGTSLDGINLHKGNNPGFLDHYPPPPGTTLDQFDQDINLGQHFTDEWPFNDYHRATALEYLRNNPRATLQGDLQKFKVLFLSVHKTGSTEEHGAMRLVELAGMLLFRLILWTAILSALYLATRPAPAGNTDLRAAAIIFLALVAACALPYLAGFAYTRHASILIYPAALMCCRILIHDKPGYTRGE